MHPAKIKVLSMGRRWGKTVMGGALSLGTASQGGRVAWIVPIYKNGRSLWRWCEQVINPVKKYGVTINRSEREILFPGGGYLGIYSADNEDAIRGEAFNLVVMDEAARISETAWTDAIQPTLADYDGDALLISTPRGRNWFWSEFQRGLADGQVQASWKAPSRDNPSPQIKKAAELAKARVSELTYLQEWEAEFVSAEGVVFRRVQEAAHVVPLSKPVEDREYIAGVDVASSVDFTVASVLDVEAKQLVFFDRFNRVDYPVLEDRLLALHKHWKLSAIEIETNSIGRPVIDHLQAKGMTIIPFTTTNASKQMAVTALQSAFEHAEIGIIDNPILIGELLSFESKRSPSGSFMYSAPEGMHDDCVMSLAIAWHAISNRVGAAPDPFADW